ncbi:copper homeostasis CutC domain-containing protein [Pseudoneurospora amorphoporcata]|uniref:Copper homeostasis protein cutC homolog n=1 Tax=Pseudoneurospora amorphoporcata TaxID=241081 RepID=A0AAN6SJ97_9PEZI|nr:copper homeostasis CutC domain-containing protein [Pseudoneurospora amorphoporcata]
MPFQLEIPIFTADIEEHDYRSFGQAAWSELIDICEGIDVARAQRIRLELNAVGSYGAGGLTPNVENTINFLHYLRKSKRLKEDQQPAIRIMIRPRASRPDHGSGFQMPEIQDFQYSHDELLAMLQSIEDFKGMGQDLFSPERGDGFVFGVQRRCKDRLHGLALDVEANKKLINAAHPFPCFLHRAFDAVLSTRQDPDIYGAPENEVPPCSVEDLVAAVKGLGFKGVLTSGGWGDATGNLKTLKELGRAALKDKDEDRFELIVGGGIRSDRVWDICLAMKDVAQHRDFWLHSSCFGIHGRFSEMQARNMLRAMRKVDAEFVIDMP